MSRPQTRWLVVRTAAGWHTRLVACNGPIILTSEPYTRRRAAYRAIGIARESFYGAVGTRADVVEVDER